MAISNFGKARVQTLRTAKQNGHFMTNGVTPWKQGPWDVQSGEYYSRCSDCPYEISMHEETNTGIVKTFHFERVDAGNVNEIASMPKCTGNGGTK